jgi:hypothetical protein
MGAGGSRDAVGSEQGDSGLAGVGPEFLLLEIEMMRLEGVVLQADHDPQDEQP